MNHEIKSWTSFGAGIYEIDATNITDYIMVLLVLFIFIIIFSVCINFPEGDAVRRRLLRCVLEKNVLQAQWYNVLYFFIFQ